MIVGRLLARGMLAGCAAAALAFLFARIFGEPQVALAIAFEAARHAGDASHAHHAAEPELVSRTVQAGYGLLTAVVLYGTAFGGIFALAFSYAYGRLNTWSPRALALLLAGAGFLTFVLVPDLKYPPNPPAVGVPATLAFRTMTYFVMIGLSVSVAAIATLIGQKITQLRNTWTGTLCGAGIFIVLIALVQFGLPDVNEVPEGFPALVLWRFREASIGMQLVLWSTMGLLFGVLATRVLTEQSSSARQ